MLSRRAEGRVSLCSRSSAVLHLRTSHGLEPVSQGSLQRKYQSVVVLRKRKLPTWDLDLLALLVDALHEDCKLSDAACLPETVRTHCRTGIAGHSPRQECP